MLDELAQDLSGVLPPRFVPAGGETEPVVGEDDRMFDVETSRVTLADVGGMGNVKERLELAFLGPLHSPQLRTLFSKSLRGGLLLYGPPGCGKTFLGRAVAGETGAKFLSVSLSDVLSMWFGEAERNLHEMFARHGGTRRACCSWMRSTRWAIAALSCVPQP